MKKYFRKLRLKSPNPDSNKFKIVMAAITVVMSAIGVAGLVVNILAWRRPVQPSTDYPASYSANDYSNTEYSGFTMGETSTSSVPAEAMELGDYSDINEESQFELPVVVTENVVIVEGRTYRNDESQLTISPTSISSSRITANITLHGQTTRTLTMRSGRVERFMLGERVFSITIDEINWGTSREDRNIVISIREYVAQ